MRFIALLLLVSTFQAKRAIEKKVLAGESFSRHLRHSILRIAEGQASDQTILSIAGHVSKKMLEHYSHIRMTAKRAALEAIAQTSEEAAFGQGVHQNVHQLQDAAQGAFRKPLN